MRLTFTYIILLQLHYFTNGLAANSYSITHSQMAFQVILWWGYMLIIFIKFYHTFPYLSLVISDSDKWPTHVSMVLQVIFTSNHKVIGLTFLFNNIPVHYQVDYIICNGKLQISHSPYLLCENVLTYKQRHLGVTVTIAGVTFVPL